MGLSENDGTMIINHWILRYFMFRQTHMRWYAQLKHGLMSKWAWGPIHYPAIGYYPVSQSPIRLEKLEPFINSWNSRFSLDLLNWPVKLTCFWPGTILPYRGSSYLVTIPFSPWASWSTSRPLWSSSWTLQPAEFTVSCEFTENLKNIIANKPDTRQKIREILSWWWT